MAFKDNPFIIRNLPENKFIISPRRDRYYLRLKYHQTEGRYTLAEAVEILSDEAKVDAVGMTIKLRQAVSDGSLKVYKPGFDNVYKSDKVKDTYEEAYSTDLNSWLDVNEPRVPFRFPEPVQTGLPDISAKGESKETASPQKIEAAGVVDDSQHAEPGIPGKMPRVSSGQCAVKAAWQIECETGRAASCNDVMKRLQQWAVDGTEPSVLIKSVPEKSAVKWQTKNGENKEYDLHACSKTLEKWKESRRGVGA